MAIVAFVGIACWAIVEVPVAVVVAFFTAGPLLGVCHGALRRRHEPLRYLNGAIRGGLVQGVCLGLLVGFVDLLDLILQPAGQHGFGVFMVIFVFLCSALLWTLFGIVIGLIAETAVIFAGPRITPFGSHAGAASSLDTFASTSPVNHKGTRRSRLPTCQSTTPPTA